MTITLDDEPCCAKQGYHRKARHRDSSLVILSKTDSAAGRQENPPGFNAALAPSSHFGLIFQLGPCLIWVIVTMGDYGWSMDSDTPQGIDAVEYGRVLEYPRKRNKISDHEKARSLQINRVRIGK